uniref:Uncharacterized protein n=1 Tax=Meloidogyne javanica TaxID=6303 RepID=A0A915LYL4_MELJA
MFYLEEQAMINHETVNEEFNHLHLTEGSNLQPSSPKPVQPSSPKPVPSSPKPVPSSPKPVDYAWLMNQDVPCHSPEFMDDVSNIGGGLNDSDNLLNDSDNLF